MDVCCVPVWPCIHTTNYYSLTINTITMKLSKFISQVAKGNTEKNVKGEGGKSQTSVGNIRETLKVANQLSDGAIYKAIRALPVIIILLISSMCSKAQISDFTTDSVYFTQGLDINIVHIDPGTFDTLQGACANEFGFSVGDNECITFGLRTINMGQHDADFNSTLDPSGVFFDSCHWHNHIEDWNTVSLLPCTTSTVSLAGGGKVGMNLMDGGNMVYWLLSGGSLNDWLSSYGIIDYTLANHPPNDDFNGDTHMGLSAGYYDTYTPSTWGNQIVITGRPNGDYVIQCKGDFSRYFNQGINIFPDSFYVPVTISGAYPNRTISIATSYPSCC